MIDEKKKQEIEKQAEDILKKFSESLKKVKIDKAKSGKKEVGGFRKEGEGEKGDEDFRRRMFSNFKIKDLDSDRESNSQDSRHAPNKEGDVIVAEKKSW